MKFLRYGIGQQWLKPQTIPNFLENHGFQVNCTDLFCGENIVSKLYLAILNSYLGGKAKIHPPIEQVGTPDLMKKIFTPKMLQGLNLRIGLSCLDLIWYTSELEDIESWMSLASSGVEKIFSVMSDGKYGICIGHDPLVGLAAKDLTEQNSIIKAERHIDFVQENGRIAVVGQDTCGLS